MTYVCSQLSTAEVYVLNKAYLTFLYKRGQNVVTNNIFSYQNDVTSLKVSSSSLRSKTREDENKLIRNQCWRSG